MLAKMLLLRCVSFLSLLVTREVLANGLEADTWDYEPRVWLPDQEDNFEPVVLNDRWQQEQEQEQPSKVFPADPSQEDYRSRINFWPQAQSAERVAFERQFEKKSSTPRRRAVRESNNEDLDSCTQFRVDIRETVICDRQRCDKFDFDWPRYDNQIVHIQTTRHGMRFYRAEYAFLSRQRSQAEAVRDEDPSLLDGRRREVIRSGTHTNSRYTNTESRVSSKPREQVLVDSHLRQQQNTATRMRPVKFDLFELFKPKTTTTNPDNNNPPRTTTSPNPNGSSSTTTTESTTTDSSADKQIEVPEEQEQQLDQNTTRLVTSYRLDTRHQMQSILGFGGALSDSTCRNIKSLSPDMAKSLMEDYFGQRGLRYNIARMSMGSSDFSTTPYTNNDSEEPTSSTNDDKQLLYQNGVGQDDVEMKRFHLVDEDYEFKLPIARQAIAMSRQEVKFFSSLWSPPIWMKNNSNIVHGWLKGDVYGPYYKALADYIVKWLEAYKKNGIEFWATTGLNEPVTGIKPFIFHNSVGITREDYVTFIKLYLGPMLRQRGFEKLKLIALDDNKGYVPHFARAVLEDQEASKYVWGVGIHWYMNDDYENLNFLTREFPDKFLLQTEGCNGYLPFQVHTLPGDWDRGVAYMYDIIKVLQKNAAGWVDWNMALDLGGGPSWAKNNLDAPIIVNAERDEYYKSPMFYAIGHFSKFIEPNSTRLDHRLANARYNRPLESVAFYTPKNYIVIVTLNANKHSVPFRVIVDRQLVKLVTLREESFNTIVFKWKRYV